MRSLAIIAIAIIWSIILQGQTSPVNPNATTETIDLLNYLYSISGKKTLSGQHDQPIFKSAYYQLVYETTGKYPALKGMDFGFSERNTLDGINFRQDIVDEAIKYHEQGCLITLMWHAAPPTMEEPVTFKGGVQSKLTQEEWDELITPGSEINLRWQSQVDVIAFFLKQIRDAGVPVIWRPYHEMNGKWFWWGGKIGDNGYKKLYLMLYDRLVNYHQLNNLLWVFNANELRHESIDAYENYYPGADYVDILATDVYSGEYTNEDYTTLKELADGKPIALGEVGKMPAAEKLLEQPDWLWFMVWVDQVFHSNSRDELIKLYHADQVVTRDELEL